MLLRLYVSGNWGSRYRLRAEVARLRALGNEVRATWTDHEEAGEPLVEAVRDLEEIRWAEALILDALDECNQTGGREFEAGFAHALWRPVYIVGPARNVFHRLCRDRWDTWDEAIRSGRFGDPVPVG